jgi:hypothetical protein
LFHNKNGGGRKIETKTMALTLVLLTAFAAIFGGLALTAFAAETGTTDTSTTAAADAESQTEEVTAEQEAWATLK